jgi:diaminohydroxyphosphoribosylaminopyrimidine deaminase/5-amino-6-(5-phosphoribosylamino)uracil reductase
MVGCVIVRDGRIIGDGFHQKFGEAHAEREALAECSESPRGANVYVNLEPCCHEGKKTAPCVPALIEAGVGRVVVGCADPNLAVRWAGDWELRRAGVGKM